MIHLLSLPMESESSFTPQSEQQVRLPTFAAFKLKLFQLRHFDKLKERPPVPEHPTASDVARYGKINWRQINHGKGSTSRQGLPRYLYYIAEKMMTREGYTGYNEAGEETEGKSLLVPIDVIGRSQWIGIADDWSVSIEGNHRLLVLRMLGPEFIENSGMNDWVNVWKMNNP